MVQHDYKSVTITFYTFSVFGEGLASYDIARISVELRSRVCMDVPKVIGSSINSRQVISVFTLHVEFDHLKRFTGAPTYLSITLCLHCLVKKLTDSERGKIIMQVGCRHASLLPCPWSYVYFLLR